MSGDFKMTADQIRSLQPELAALLAVFRPCFARVSSFAHWERYIVGLITDLKRKSIEPIALAAGVPVRTLQEFLSLFRWDEDRAREQLNEIVGGDGAFAVVQIDTLWRDTAGNESHWDGIVSKGYTKVGDEWKLIMHTGVLKY